MPRDREAKENSITRALRRLAPGQQRAYLGELRIRRRERLVPAP